MKNLSLTAGVVGTLFALIAIVAPHNASALTVDLWEGSRGDDVVTLQTLLESQNYLVMPMGVMKGYFGPLTKAALKKYQTSVGVKATGYFGPLTRSAWMMHSTNSMTMSPDKPMSGEAGVMVGGAIMVPRLDIVQNAVNASNVKIVVAAVQAAGLVDTLKSAGPFTVFAPTDMAFAKLPADTVPTLIKPENKAQLTSILTYHVVSGTYRSSDLTDGLVLKTVEGKTLKFTKDAQGKIWINGSAMIETADVVSKNGVTHVIDTVLMPTASKYNEAGVEVGGALMVPNLDIVDNALNASNVTTVVAAVKAAGLVDTLKSAGPFTVFAPNNDAFAKLPAGTVETLLKPENKNQLVSILTYHVVPGRYSAKDLMAGIELTTVEGKKLMFTSVNGMLMINGKASVVTPNVVSKNGVTHVIDTVLIP